MHQTEFDLPLLRRLQKILRPLFDHFFNVTETGDIPWDLEGPYVLLANHSNWWDPFFLMLRTKRPLYFVATEDLFSLFPYSLFIARLGAIPKVKFLPDLDTVKTLFRVRDQGHSVGIFPEGERNWDGHTLPLLPATLKLVRKLREPVIVASLRGAQLSFPRWAYFPRRGKVEIVYCLVVAREETPSIGEVELEKRILTAFTHDDLEWNRGKRISFKGFFRTAGLGAMLYLCPSCGKSGTLHPALGSRFGCGFCGLSLRLDEFGDFVPAMEKAKKAENGEPFRLEGPTSIPEWHRWEKATLSAALDEAIATGTRGPALLLDGFTEKLSGNIEEPLMAERGVRLYRRLRSGGRVSLELALRGDFLVYPDRILFRGSQGDREFLLEKIDGINVLYRNLLDFAVGGELYRVIPRNGSRCLLAFLHAIRHLSVKKGVQGLGSDS
jgi:1-acyl-sn-glycerol-3-phosphate acyltransferase